MRYIVLSVLAILLAVFSPQVRAQTNISSEDLVELEALEDTLGVLAYAFVNDSLEENRYFAVRSFIPKLVSGLKRTNSFQYQFDQLKTVSIQYPADSTFRIFTWQLYVDKDTYRYYGAIQMNTPDLQLFPLVDRSFELDTQLEYTECTADQWYGSVYYNLYTVNEGEQPYYLLFGFDGHTFFRKRKVVDVLRFVDGQPVFGAPVFHRVAEGRTITQSRLLFEYSANASIKCNYDLAHEMILFDHLTTIGGEYGEGPTNIPDGTYEGYRLENGQWQHVEKVFNTILNEPPRPEPVLGSGRGGKDILGRGGR